MNKYTTVIWVKNISFVGNIHGGNISRSRQGFTYVLNVKKDLEIVIVYFVIRRIVNQLSQHISMITILQLLDKKSLLYFDRSETTPNYPKIQALIDEIINDNG